MNCICNENTQRVELKGSRKPFKRYWKNFPVKFLPFETHVRPESMFSFKKKMDFTFGHVTMWLGLLVITLIDLWNGRGSKISLCSTSEQQYASNQKNPLILDRVISFVRLDT